MLWRGPYLQVVAIYGPVLVIPLGVIPQAVCSGASRQRKAVHPFLVPIREPSRQEDLARRGLETDLHDVLVAVKAGTWILVSDSHRERHLPALKGDMQAGEAFPLYFN
ncbi:MAG: hypothetical protein K0R62_3288 [Nonomuraea muscovyensis]|nr:hypothetical protein [Nonomuraea muscovyensis]